MKHAIAEIAASSSATPANVAGSVALTPNKSVAIARVSASAPAVPAATPIARMSEGFIYVTDVGSVKLNPPLRPGRGPVSTRERIRRPYLGLY